MVEIGQKSPDKGKLEIHTVTNKQVDLNARFDKSLVKELGMYARLTVPENSTSGEVSNRILSTINPLIEQGEEFSMIVLVDNNGEKSQNIAIDLVGQLSMTVAILDGGLLAYNEFLEKQLAMLNG
ncbi:MAG: hypothetical protein GY697_25090, partial [Desulfobacterales bacterium]|nr:hypothetical protein [Desulfobacterales bacterium]